MKKHFYIIIFVFIVAGCRNQIENTELGSNRNDTLDKYLVNLCELNQSDKEKLTINENVFSTLKAKKNNQNTRNSLSLVVSNFDKLGDIDKTNISSKLLQTISISSKDTLNLANAYYYFGNTYLSKDVSDSAYYYYLKAEKIFLKKGDGRLLSDLYLNKSIIQLTFNDYLGAEFSSAQALKFSRLNQNLLGQYDAYTNLGVASHGNENYMKAVEYHEKALKIAKDNNLHPEYYLQEISLNNIGNCYQNLRKYNEAIKVFERALQNKQLYYRKPGLYATLLDNLAYCKFKLKSKDNFQTLFFKALRVRDSLKLYSKVIYSKIHLSEFYQEKKDTLSSQKYALDALRMAKSTQISNDLLISLKQLSLVQNRDAAKYSNEYIKISDSLQQEERKAKDKFARIAFETDEIIQQKDKLTEQNRALLYFFIGTLFLGILLFVIRTQRAKNRELLLKQQQQKVNEEIYNLMISQQATIEENRVKEKKRIAQELHDGVLGRLFGARLNLDSLNRFSDEESINNRFNYLNELKNIEQDIREISHDLNREKYVLINNFVAIVSNLLEEQSSSFDPILTSSLDESIKWDKVANTVKINLYRILQESLQNINKYANAKHITVEFKNQDNHILLTITDDGDGFDVNTKKRGIGLQNMQSRVAECEGTFEIKSKKGKGTQTTVSVPMEKKTIEAE